MKSKSISLKKNFYLPILDKIKGGANLSKIKKDLKISKQSLYYYLRQLENKGHITKLSRGYYKISKRVEHPPKISKRNVRGHAFIWKLKPDRKFKWKARLRRLKIPTTLIRNVIPRIIINNRKVWLTKNSIIIYEPFSFYGINAIESRKYAVISLLETIEKLELKLRVSLGRYQFMPSREHYGLIRNDLAVQCNRRGEKLNISDSKDGEWLWIDNSLSIGELETGGKGITKDRAHLNIDVQNWWNDNKQHDFKVTPTFLMENLNALVEDRRYWAEHQKSHVEAIQTLSKTVKQLQGEIKRLRNASKEVP